MKNKIATLVISLPIILSGCKNTNEKEAFVKNQAISFFKNELKKEIFIDGVEPISSFGTDTIKHIAESKKSDLIERQLAILKNRHDKAKETLEKYESGELRFTFGSPKRDYLSALKEYEDAQKGTWPDKTQEKIDGLDEIILSPYQLDHYNLKVKTVKDGPAEYLTFSIAINNKDTICGPGDYLMNYLVGQD